MLVPPPVPAVFALLSNGFNKSSVENVAGADLQPRWWRDGREAARCSQNREGKRDL